MPDTLGSLRRSTQRRLGDVGGRFWTGDEIDDALRAGYRELAMMTRCFTDWTYLENLPAGFSMTAAWERPFAAFEYGVANYTMADELRMLTEASRLGPANHTVPAEATEGHLSDVGASTAIPATATLPTSVTELETVLWDRQTITALTARDLRSGDSRYHLTEGDVYGYTWQQDGVRTLRKVRVPAAQADTHTVTGSWGLVRRLTDVCSDSVTGTWGLPRRIPGEHPIGVDHLGAPRRFFRDGLNVRVEHWRYGRTLDTALTACEVTEAYARYLRDYACWTALSRPGPGQQPRLAGHYKQRWDRGVARVLARKQAVRNERVGYLGSGTVSVAHRPPRPRLPWQYGQEVR